MGKAVFRGVQGSFLGYLTQVATCTFNCGETPDDTDFWDKTGEKSVYSVKIRVLILKPEQVATWVIYYICCFVSCFVYGQITAQAD